MNISYTDPKEGTEVASRTREFMEEVVIPAERELQGGQPASESLLTELREAAREYDVYGPQLPSDYGGLGLGFRAMLPVFEEAGRSLLGPDALRINAPDEGNMHLFELAGTAAQRTRWYEPIARGEIKSAFSMTEPLNGGGSDPKMIQTTARRDGDEWVIDGHKWWTSQATEAQLLIVMAVTDPDAHPYEGTSMFLVPADSPGVEIERNIPHLGDTVTRMTHGEVFYDGVRVPESAILGDIHDGFSLAQRRLAPARLTHCMRYSGMCERALAVAKAYADQRTAFGEQLSEKQAVQFRIAEAETALHAVRTMVRHAADRFTRGNESRVETAMCKVFASNVFQDIIDGCVQTCGANGIGKDLPLADFYENVRILRIADGPDAVHKRTIASGAFEEVTLGELAQVRRY